LAAMGSARECHSFIPIGSTRSLHRTASIGYGGGPASTFSADQRRRLLQSRTNDGPSTAFATAERGYRPSSAPLGGIRNPTTPSALAFSPSTVTVSAAARKRPASAAAMRLPIATVASGRDTPKVSSAPRPASANARRPVSIITPGTDGHVRLSRLGISLQVGGCTGTSVHAACSDAATGATFLPPDTHPVSAFILSDLPLHHRQRPQYHELRQHFAQVAKDVIETRPAMAAVEACCDGLEDASTSENEAVHSTTTAAQAEGGIDVPSQNASAHASSEPTSAGQGTPMVSLNPVTPLGPPSGRGDDADARWRRTVGVPAHGLRRREPLRALLGAADGIRTDNDGPHSLQVVGSRGGAATTHRGSVGSGRCSSSGACAGRVLRPFHGGASVATRRPPSASAQRGSWAEAPERELRSAVRG
jgi:hypothetical protein